VHLLELDVSQDLIIALTLISSLTNVDVAVVVVCAFGIDIILVLNNRVINQLICFLSLFFSFIL